MLEHPTGTRGQGIPRGDASYVSQQGEAHLVGLSLQTSRSWLFEITALFFRVFVSPSLFPWDVLPEERSQDSIWDREVCKIDQNRHGLPTLRDGFSLDSQTGCVAVIFEE